MGMRVVMVPAASGMRKRHDCSRSIRRQEADWAKGGGAESDFGGGERRVGVLKVRLCESG